MPLRVASVVARGPHGGGSSRLGEAAKPAGRSARAAGLALIVAMWIGLMTGATVVTSVVVSAARPTPTEPKPGGEPAAVAPSSTGLFDLPDAARQPHTPAGSLHCSRRVGTGAAIPEDVLFAVAAALPELAQPFHLCAAEELTWRQSTGTYEQTLFTRDGDGAVLVAWDLASNWVVTFISSDDGAGYRIVSRTLDWGVLGRPHSFVRCDGLWLQAFEGPNGELVGAGLRDRDDAEGREDRPIFVWGATVEVLLSDNLRTLLLPAGSPASDGGGPLQYFFGRRQPVRSPRTSADHLTVRDLLLHCGY